MNATKPTTPCRCCGHTMDAVWQPGLLPGREGMWLITCRNKTCDMRQYTFSERNYPAVDLSKYVPCKAIG